MVSVALDQLVPANLEMLEVVVDEVEAFLWNVVHNERAEIRAQVGFMQCVYRLADGLGMWVIFSRIHMPAREN